MTKDNDTHAALELLDRMADAWSAEIDAPGYGARIAAKDTGRAEAIEAMMRQSFIEGAYRMFLLADAG